MRDKFKKFIEVVREIKMTEGERAAVYFNATSEFKPITSPYSPKFSFFHLVRIVGTTAMILVIGIAGLSYASASALPGEPLYAIKTNLKEKIEDKLTFSSENKIALRQQRIQVRFSEAKTLIKEKKLTSEKLSVVEAKILEDKQKIGDALVEINKDNPEAVVVAKTDLEASIEESGQKINTLIEENDIESIAGEEIHYGEIDKSPEGEDDIILPILKEAPDDTKDIPPMDPTSKIDDGSVVQDLKIIPDPLDVVSSPEPTDQVNSDTNKNN